MARFPPKNRFPLRFALSPHSILQRASVARQTQWRELRTRRRPLPGAVLHPPAPRPLAPQVSEEPIPSFGGFIRVRFASGGVQTFFKEGGSFGVVEKRKGEEKRGVVRRFTLCVAAGLSRPPATLMAGAMHQTGRYTKRLAADTHKSHKVPSVASKCQTRADFICSPSRRRRWCPTQAYRGRRRRRRRRRWGGARRRR